MTKITFSEDDILVLGSILNAINDKQELCFCDVCHPIFLEFYERMWYQLISLDENTIKH